MGFQRVMRHQLFGHAVGEVTVQSAADIDLGQFLVLSRGIVAKLAADHTRVFAVHFPFPVMPIVRGRRDSTSRLDIQA